MKFCIASDSHGSFSLLCRMLEREQPDCLLFLGDGAEEAQRAAKLLGTACLCVVGNCDLCSPEPPARTLEQGGVTLFMAHGHRFGVKQGLESFAQAACQAGASVGLFGHTHRPYAKQWGTVLLCNPGSLRDGVYLRAEAKDGQFHYQPERMD